ncbi:MAG: hypothetical protein D6715_10885 [Calditrichaeota bacterium]|nr:MAG: hypothetical protein D6715_10885 [Calditrichota bacterium]
MLGRNRHVKKGWWGFVPMLIAWLFVWMGPGRAQTARIAVKYITVDGVYLAAGKLDGLAVGDQLVVRKNNRFAALLEVQELARHSALCRIVEQKQQLAVGDIAILIQKAEKKQPSSDSTQVPETAPEKQTPGPQQEQASRKVSSVKRPTPKGNLTGSISVQSYYLDDRSEANLDFYQPSLRFSLRWQNLWGKGYQLQIRSRARYNQRDRAFGDRIPRTEWRNRLYLFTFGRTDPAVNFHFQVGRILLRQVSSVGYIDGLMVEQRTAGNWYLGLFGGTRPQWQSSRFQSSLQKVGLFVRGEQGSYRQLHWEGTLAVAGEYHGRTVSREFVALQNQLRGKGWQFYQSAELDINRQWRYQRTGQRLALSNLFLSLYTFISPAVRLSLSYDNRQNYWSYDTRTVEDSLFDDLFRRGMRANLYVRAPGRLLISASGGLRHRQGESQNTYTYGGSISRAGFLFNSLRLSAQASAFTGPMSDGLSWSAMLSRYDRSGQLIGIGFRNYRYTFSQTGFSRTNQTLIGQLQIHLAGNIFLFSTYEHGLNGDLKSRRLLVEAGYRF